MVSSHIDAYHKQLIAAQKNPAARIFPLGHQATPAPAEQPDEDAEVSAKVVRAPKRKGPTTSEGAETA